MKHESPKLVTLLMLAAIALMSTLGSMPVLAAHHEMDATTSAALDAAIGGDHRSEENKARDKFRRPKQTLEFFGFRSDMTT